MSSSPKCLCESAIDFVVFMGAAQDYLSMRISFQCLSILL